VSFIAHPPKVKLVHKNTKRGKERLKQHGDIFRLIANQPNRKLVATEDGRWMTWVETNDADFSIQDVK